MPNLMDYLEWREDLTFSEAPLNEVDNLLFCLLSYVDLDGIVPSHQKGRITVREAAAEYFFTHPHTEKHPLGLIIPAHILTLFRRMALAPRFRDLELTGFVNEVSEARETQFAAVTVRLPAEGLFVAFRGTDDTVVGWKEDFKLSYMDQVPAQTNAAAYLNRLDMTPDTLLYVGGHSKGGNLAVWGAVHAEERVRERIVQVYSNDGPGFSEGTVTSEAYRSLAPRIRILFPEDSLVGLLLEHDSRYTVVRSSRRGLLQHDGLTWEVMGSRFLRAEGLSRTGVHNDTVVRERIDHMTPDERREFISLMFSLLESTGAKTLTELHEERFKAAIHVLKAFRELPKERQETAAYLWDKLFGSGLDSTTARRKSTAARQPTKSPRGEVRVELFPRLRP